jgi:hypothetical protein
MTDRPPSIGEPESGTEMTGRNIAVANYSKHGKVAATSRIGARGEGICGEWQAVMKEISLIPSDV